MIVTSALILAGCAPRLSQTNLSNSELVLEPSTRTLINPDVNFALYKTFAVIPNSSLNKDSKLSGIEEVQIIFQARNFMEIRGYRFVNLNDTPDLIMVVNAQGDYKSQYIPPSSYTAPIYGPGSTVSSYSNSYGSVNAYGSGGSAYGNYSGYGTTTTQLPGYYTNRTYSTPGYTEGYFYPSVGFILYDTKKSVNAFQGNGVGTSKNADLRVSSQIVSESIIGDVPRSSASRENLPERPGSQDADIAIWAADGNNYYPIILSLKPKSSFEVAGLAVGDFIISVDGIPTKNKTYHEIYNIVYKNKGESTLIEFNRLSDTKKTVVKF